MASNELLKALHELGQYYGLRTLDSYIQKLIDEGADLSMSANIPNPSDPRTLVLNDVNGAGESTKSMSQLLDFIAEGVGGDSSYLKRLNSDICITPANPSFGADKEKHPLNTQKVQLPGDGVVDESQGLFKPSVGDYYTVSDYFPLSDDDTPETKLHVVQVFRADSNVSNTDTYAISLFMNSIPTLEFSRAVPLIDITVLSKGDPTDYKKTRPMSLGRFLIGESMAEEDLNNQQIFAAMGPGATADTTMQGQEASADGKSYMAVASMDVFTSPQTLTPSNRDGSLRVKKLSTDDAPLDPFMPPMSLNSLTLNSVNTQGMHSYKSADLSITLHDRSQMHAIAPLVQPGALGTQATKLEITYGWSHPDGSNSYQNSSRTSDSDQNRYADIINAMRVTEVFNVVNSSFSFNEDGSVAIELKLATDGATSFQLTDITLPEVVDSYSKLAELTKSAGEHLNKYRKRVKKVGKINIPTYLSRATNANQAATMKSKDVKKLQKYLKGAKDKDLTAIGGFVEDIIAEKKRIDDSKAKAIDRMLGHLAKTPDPYLRELPEVVIGNYGTRRIKSTISLRARAKITELKELVKEYEDPYFHTGGVQHDVDVDTEAFYDTTEVELKEDEIAHLLADIKKLESSQEQVRYVKSRIADLKGIERKKGDGVKTKFVSLGKILSFFVAGALAKTEDADEIHMVFHAFNDSASYMQDCNISQFPIPLGDFSKQLKNAFKASGKMSIREFLQFVNRLYIKDQGAPAYGLSTLYGKRDDENPAKRKYASKYSKGSKEKRSAKIANVKSGILKAAYGLTESDDEGSISFKVPHLNLRLETVKDSIDETKTILKMHVFDQKCSTAENLQSILDGFSEGGIGRVMKRKSDPGVRGSKHSEVYTNQISYLQSGPRPIIADLPSAEKVASKIGWNDVSGLEKFLEGRYVIDVDNMDRLKENLSSLFPGMTYGTEATGIISAQLATENNPALATVRMVGAAKKDPDAPGTDDGLPMMVTPTSLTLETFGCPLFAVGQQLFVDFSTNTTADNFYGVFEVNHSLEPGKFTTSLKMGTLSSFGKWHSTLDNLKDTVAQAAKAAEEGSS